MLKKKIECLDDLLEMPLEDVKDLSNEVIIEILKNEDVEIDSEWTRKDLFKELLSIINERKDELEIDNEDLNGWIDIIENFDK